MGRVLIGLLCTAALAGCGPLGGNGPFGRSSDLAAPSPAPLDGVADARPPIDRVETLTVMQTPTGAVIRATGIAPAQGAWNGALIPSPQRAPGVLAYTFRAIPPETPGAVSTPRSREVTVAVSVPNRQLAGIREIRVSGASNARSVQR
ncbi:hypothetical protein [Palleronia rufa]|uniref:hypothetical protein n=1 Tax=Palleronia rufa TaxID=1530186 RepID=UPI0005687D2F|nr:hypothetical protein [Palleronia rufa]